MNDHELDLGLADLGTARVQPTAPPMLRQRIRQTALPSTTERGSLLPSITLRFQSLFDATKLVVAAAIVALFGGLLLASVLMQQRDESLPAVGASASPLTTSQPVRLPAEIPENIDSGTMDTPLGPARWIHLSGRRRMLPDLIDAAPVATGGYVALDREGPSPRLWRSQDLITWAPESLPMAVEALYPSLALTDDGLWLKTYEPTSLWRSEDSLAWDELSLQELVPPAPMGPWLLDLGEPLTFDGRTVIPFRALPDHLLVHRALGGTIDARIRAFCCRAREAGVYRLSDDKGRQVVDVRFELAAGGLRVVDAGDATELAFLDGVELDFIELLTTSDFRPDVLGLAALDQGRLVPLGLPDAILEDPGTGFAVDEAGFVAYSLGHDGLVHIRRSEEGLRWTEVDVVGDDPGEPTDIEGVGTGRWSLHIGEHDNTIWTQDADGSWTSRRDEPFEFPFGDGSLRARLDEIEMGQSDRDALWYRPDSGNAISIDPDDDLGIVAQIQLDLQSDQGTEGYNFVALSGDTAVLSYAGGGRRHLWIVTFDELTG